MHFNTAFPSIPRSSRWSVYIAFSISLLSSYYAVLASRLKHEIILYTYSVVQRWATDWMIGGGNFFLHRRVQTGSGAHPASTRGSFPGGL